MRSNRKKETERSNSERKRDTNKRDRRDKGEMKSEWERKRKERETRVSLTEGQCDRLASGNNGTLIGQ